MKTQIFNKVYNVPVTIDTEEFVKVGADLDVYILQNSKLRSVDSVSATVIDLLGAKYNDLARAFLIATDSTGAWTFSGGTTEMVDSTGLTYALFDATSCVFAGFYTLATGGVATYVSGGNNIENSKEYVARIIDDMPVSFVNEAVKAQARLKTVIAKGLDKIFTISETSDTTTNLLTVSIKLLANQYTADIDSFKVVVLDSKYYKRLQFPFHTTFTGTQHNVGSTVTATYTLDTQTRFYLIFFKDIYGNISFPLVYAINP